MKVLTSETELSQQQLDQIKLWDIQYLGKVWYRSSACNLYFFIESDDCIGYAETLYNVALNRIDILWFCAPRNGTRCFEQLLVKLKDEMYNESTKISLVVSINSQESPKATPARLNLYYSFGFKTMQNYWPRTEQPSTSLRMGKMLYSN